MCLLDRRTPSASVEELRKPPFERFLCYEAPWTFYVRSSPSIEKIQRRFKEFFIATCLDVGFYFGVHSFRCRHKLTTFFWFTRSKIPQQTLQFTLHMIACGSFYVHKIFNWGQIKGWNHTKTMRYDSGTFFIFSFCLIPSYVITLLLILGRITAYQISRSIHSFLGLLFSRVYSLK